MKSAGRLLTKVWLAGMAVWIGGGGVEARVRPRELNFRDIRLMTEKMKTASDEERIKIIQDLQSQRDPSIVPVLAVALGDRLPNVRAQAMNLLGSFQDAGAMNGWFEALKKTGYPDVKSRAIFHLRQETEKEVRSLLREALRDPEPSVRVAAIGALTSPMDAQAVKAVEAGLEDSSLFVQAGTWQFVREARDPALLPLLTSLAAATDPVKRNQAIQAIGSIEGERSVEVLNGMWKKASDPELMTVILSALQQTQHPKSVSALREGLKRYREHPEMARLALEALARLGLPDGMAGVVEALEFNDPNFRWRAAKILGDGQTPQGLSVLVEALGKNPFPEVRQQAVIALATVGILESRQTLKAAMTDPDDRVKFQAAGALKEEWAATADFPGEFKNRGPETNREEIDRLTGKFPVEELIAEVQSRDVRKALPAMLALWAVDYSRNPDGAVKAAAALQPFQSMKLGEVDWCLRDAADQSARRIREHHRPTGGSRKKTQIEFKKMVR